MKYTLALFAAATLVSFSVNNASAALTTGTTLNFTAGQYVCPNGGTFPSCNDAVVDVTGSWWAFDIMGDGVIDATDQVVMAPGADGGLVIGVTQQAGDIDDSWSFLGNPGNHVTTSPVTVVSDSGATRQLDFSGWAMEWNYNFIPIGDILELQLADISCSSVNCDDGDSFTLDFFSTVPEGDPSSLGGLTYALHLEGVISAVPLPAAVWMMLSGLGLFGLVAKKRNRACVSD